MTKIKRYTMRYSPKPMSEYGISNSMLDTPERWNLAYLSHDYEKARFHRDPQFAVHVRRTSQMRLDGKGLDLTGSCPPEMLVESFFRLPAPRAVHLILKFHSNDPLPLFSAYGNTWVNTMVARSKQCWYDEQGLEPEPVMPNLSANNIARQLLKKVSQS